MENKEMINHLTSEVERLETILHDYQQFILRAISAGLIAKDENDTDYNDGLLKAYNVAYFKLQELYDK